MMYFAQLLLVGQGYSRAFERDFNEVIRKIKNNEKILIIDGPDDLCRSVNNQADSHYKMDRFFTGTNWRFKTFPKSWIENYQSVAKSIRMNYSFMTCRVHLKTKELDPLALIVSCKNSAMKWLPKTSRNQYCLYSKVTIEDVIIHS